MYLKTKQKVNKVHDVEEPASSNFSEFLNETCFRSGKMDHGAPFCYDERRMKPIWRRTMTWLRWSWGFSWRTMMKVGGLTPAKLAMLFPTRWKIFTLSRTTRQWVAWSVNVRLPKVKFRASILSQRQWRNSRSLIQDYVCVYALWRDDMFPGAHNSTRQQLYQWFSAWYRLKLISICKI